MGKKPAKAKVEESKDDEDDEAGSIGKDDTPAEAQQEEQEKEEETDVDDHGEEKEKERTPSPKHQEVTPKVPRKALASKIESKGQSTFTPKSASQASSTSKSKLTEDRNVSLDVGAFLESARALTVAIGFDDAEGHVISLRAMPKEFSTGSFGWTASKNAKIPLGDASKSGKNVDVSISLNMVVKANKSDATEPASENGIGKKRKVTGDANE